jgi:hypothetical protein
MEGFFTSRYLRLRNKCQTKPYEFIGFGAVDVTKSYKFICFGDIHGPKPYKFIGFRWAFISQTPVARRGHRRGAMRPPLLAHFLAVMGRELSTWVSVLSLGQVSHAVSYAACAPPSVGRSGVSTVTFCSAARGDVQNKSLVLRASLLAGLGVAQSSRLA